MVIEKYKTAFGYIVRVKPPRKKHWMYVESYRNGLYKFSSDYTYAAGYTMNVAIKHIERLKEMERCFG